MRGSLLVSSVAVDSRQALLARISAYQWGDRGILYRVTQIEVVIEGLL